MVRTAVLCLASALLGATLAWVAKPSPPPPPSPVAAVAPPAPPSDAQQRRARRDQEEASVVGLEAAPYAEARWLQGDADPKGLDLVVFWEVWCPHCKREVPKLQALADALGEDGLEVVGLTRLTRGTTEAQARAFLDAEHVGYAIGVVDDDAAEALKVSGVPAAAVLRDGRVVWRGHPAQLDEAKLRTWLKGA